jgi:hypothetical protein
MHMCLRNSWILNRWIGTELGRDYIYKTGVRNSTIAPVAQFDKRTRILIKKKLKCEIDGLGIRKKWLWQYPEFWSQWHEDLRHDLLSFINYNDAMSRRGMEILLWVILSIRNTSCPGWGIVLKNTRPFVAYRWPLNWVAIVDTCIVDRFFIELRSLTSWWFWVMLHRLGL